MATGESAREQYRAGNVNGRAAVPTNRRSISLHLAALLAVTAMLSCGDGGTEPTPDPPRPTTVTVTPANAVLSALGATVQLSAEVRDQNGRVLTGASVTWTGSATTVATVDASGLVMAVGNGTATITAMAGSVSGSATVTVEQVVTAVAVSPDTAKVVQGDTLRLSATATDANGHMVAEAQFAWSSSDTLVAVVDDSGLATGVAAGRATITATSSQVMGHAEFVTVAPAPRTVAVVPETVGFTALGQTLLLEVGVYDQLGRLMEGVAVSWSSGDTMVAVVDSVGLVTAVGRGETRVVAMAGDISGEAQVTVGQRVAAIEVTPSADTVAPGDTLRLAARAYDLNTHVIDDAVFTWLSRDTSVATIDDSGLVLGIDEGVTTIVATSGGEEGGAEITVINPDRSALVALYNATGGPGWTRSDNWGTPAPLRDWRGIYVNDRGRTSRLELPANNLSGSIPPEIGALPDLESLNLGRNNLRGSIPPEIGALTNLKRLYLTDNNLSGSIPPEIGNLPDLKHLYLSRNNLRGSIPAEIGELSTLELLRLDDNDLSGSIPREIGQLQNLKQLYLRNTELAGQIPPELASLANLEHLDLRQNNLLTGPIPPELGRLGNLRTLQLGGATLRFGGSGIGGLTGPIPAELGHLTNLKILNLAINRLTGSIPPELGLLSELEELRLDHNRLTGPIPPELGDLAKLRSLSLTANWGLTAFPREIGRLANLEQLHAQFTSVTTIPPELGNLTNLKHLWLGFSRLSGSIPPELGNLANLESLSLALASLTGPIPPELGNLASLKSLLLGNNDLDGPIPPELGGLANLEDMDLRANNLTGPIPAELGSLTRLQELLLNDNRLTSIPHGLGGMESLVSLNLGRNHLASDGLPPGAFSGLPSLEQLDLSGNQLTHLPDGIFLGMPRLSVLRLDQNPGTPFALTLEALRVDADDPSVPGPASVEVHLREGAPLDLRIPLSVHGGAVSENTAVLVTGTNRSTGVSVNRHAGSRSGTEVVMGPLPTLPHRLSGLRLEVTGSLVLFGDISNRAPAPRRNLPWIRMREGDEPRGVNVSSYFDDPDGDELQYSVVSSDPGVVSLSLADDRLTVTPLAPGSTTITVTATDPGGLAAESSLTVSVRGVRRGSYAIDLIMVDSPGEDVQAVFDDAVEYWESILADTELPDIPIGAGVSLGCRDITTDQSLEIIDDLAIVASVGEVDGPGRVLGWAALCAIREGSQLPLIGALRFDAADLEELQESDAMEEVIIHEIGHLLGIGTVWDEQGLLISPSLVDGRGADTHFRGPLAIAAFDDAGGEIYTGGGKVPVENFAGRGSADSHWRESVLDRELMTPALTVGVPNPLSAITLQSLADMGYTVDLTMAEPFLLPGTADRAPGEQVRKIEYGDDIRRGPIVVFGRDGRVVRVIAN